MNLEINTSSEETIIASFKAIATKLFTDYKLIVNDKQYRFLDLEFYYHADKDFEDIYAHKHPHQLENSKWYSHGSGMDITFGNNKNHGGILIRAIAEIDKDFKKENYFIKNEIHGPLNVKTEILSGFRKVFDQTPNTFFLVDISRDRHGASMIEPENIIATERIGLTESKDLTEGSKFFKGKFRFVIFPHLKLKNKTKIAEGMMKQFPDLSIDDINKKFGSKFL